MWLKRTVMMSSPCVTWSASRYRAGAARTACGNMTKYAAMSGLLSIEPTASQDEVAATVRRWVDEHVPQQWRDAAARGGAGEIRKVRSRADYLEWYPVFGASGLVVPSW